MSAASYWQPPHYTVTAWLEHAPFAYWLMDAIRPRVVVELGTHFGYSYFVFCEAVVRLGLETRTFALDSWEGDDQAGIYDETVYEFVSRTNERQYAGFSSLLRGYFDESLDKVADGTIDLLHIDGRHGYEDVRHDFESWLPKLSPRAVVLFHDIAEHQEGFGVWRLWDELSKKYPSFAFDHAHGLGVLGVGTDLPQAITAFFDAGRSSAEEIKRRYVELGSALAERARLELLPAEVESLKAHWASSESGRLAAEQTADALRGELDRVGSELQSVSAELRSVRSEMERRLAEYRASTSWRLTAPVRAIGGLIRRRP
ncbi:class I SAM-dependent methyltransferase [Mycetocola sp.]|uniref:class I SAM-dependent methyltransferase n=1 Tax=Mycetocola sp. TaxID=1871042 RepID=UPI003988CDA4